MAESVIYHFDEEGKTFAAAATPNRWKAYDTQTSTLSHEHHEAGRRISVVKFGTSGGSQADRSRLLIGYSDGCIHYWDLLRLERLFDVSPREDQGLQLEVAGSTHQSLSPIADMVVSPGQQSFFTCGGDGSVSERSLGDGAATGTIKVARHGVAVKRIAISHDGTKLASISGAGRLKLWDLTSFDNDESQDTAGQRRRIDAKFTGMQADVSHIRFAPDDRFLLTLAADTSVHLWRLPWISDGDDGSDDHTHRNQPTAPLVLTDHETIIDVRVVVHPISSGVEQGQPHQPAAQGGASTKQQKKRKRAAAAAAKAARSWADYTVVGLTNQGRVALWWLGGLAITLDTKAAKRRKVSADQDQDDHPETERRSVSFLPLAPQSDISCDSQDKKDRVIAVHAPTHLSLTSQESPHMDMLVVRGFRGQPTFERVRVDAKVETTSTQKQPAVRWETVSLAPCRALVALEDQKGEGAAAGAGGEKGRRGGGVALGPLDVRASRPAAKMTEGEGKVLEAMAHKLAKQNKSKKGRVAVTSMASVVRQALTSDDPQMLESALRSKLEPVIAATLAELPSDLVAKLLEHITLRIHAKPMGMFEHQKWLRAILTNHTGYLMTMPHCRPMLHSLYEHIQQRTANHPTVVRLYGKLDLLLNHTRTVVAQQKDLAQERMERRQALVDYKEGEEARRALLDDSLIRDLDLEINGAATHEDNEEEEDEVGEQWSDESGEGDDEDMDDGDGEGGEGEGEWSEDQDEEHDDNGFDERDQEAEDDEAEEEED
ncbi:unnamed protein product [Vitrella brassicaformis CCMP3155]|uniref:Small-subunit processome Utp12 domain-containing protein n=2 Tax=Vitrella brassicaformis TaxID=1169539 RepID=A0A0G4F1I4_VITBC|nr:unnamed protein product [Vitrella brassicaformis CCMP3155]|eukprot:CEM05250.1 unnamed protein product [Vitrella brassicaformis CCMP3155]